MCHQTTQWTFYLIMRAIPTTCVTVRAIQSHGLIIVIDAYSVWSNFEIADMDFWRSEAYTKFFEYLENTGGFYYEVFSRYLFFRIR
jgi:hypothetical protein